MSSPLKLTEHQILSARGSKNAVDPRRPYAYLVEEERSAAGVVEPVATLFLTNRECPLQCVYCDLWKNTTDQRVTAGDIPAQIDHALSRLPPARHIKLYNSGNFFDPQAIPREDHAAIARRVRDFQTLIIENHPLFCDERCLEFRPQLAGELEVAIGLETADPEILPRLNKRMMLDDFARAAGFLRDHDLHVRAFIMLKPPYCRSEESAVAWAIHSVEFAVHCGARCCSIIPTRGGNGIMEALAKEGLFSPPRLDSLETVLESALALPEVVRGQVRIFADLWDIERLADCPRCTHMRILRLKQMNDTQARLPPIECNCGAIACSD
ncbi:MAG TPA: radical SAM protein [Pirellulaceae bacterium]|nr:radical SAM protein [Pirellulaceae bacterium]